jgi:AcrR family transcriptional regulator
LDAAGELFAANGYAGTTIEQIARQAGASTKTIYSRYSGKTDILLALAMRLVESVWEDDPDRPVGDDPREFLTESLQEATLLITTKAAGLNRLALSEGHRSKELQQWHDAVIERNCEFIRQALVKWQAMGLLPALDDPAKAASLCLTMGTDRVRIRTALGTPANREEINEEVAYAVDFFLRACGYDFGSKAPEPPRQ